MHLGINGRRHLALHIMRAHCKFFQFISELRIGNGNQRLCPLANLHGKTLRERAEALIAIADPRFRDELGDFAVRSHYMERQAAAVIYA